MGVVAPLSLELLCVIYNVAEELETFPMSFSDIHQESLLIDTVNLHILHTRKRRTETNCPKMAHLVCRMDLAH